MGRSLVLHIRNRHWFCAHARKDSLTRSGGREESDSGFRQYFIYSVAEVNYDGKKEDTNWYSPSLTSFLCEKILCPLLLLPLSSFCAIFYSVIHQQHHFIPLDASAVSHWKCVGLLDFTRDLWEWRGWCYAIIIPSSTYANLCVYLSKDCWAVIQTYFRGELPVRGILGAGWLVPCNYIKCTNSNWCCITGTEVATMIGILLWIKWTNGQGDKNCYRSAQVVIYKEYTHYKQVLIKFRSFALSVRTDLSEDKVKDQIIIHSSHDTTIRIWSRQVNPSNWDIIEGIFVFWEFYNLIKCTGAFLLLSCGRVLPASWTPAKWIIEIKRPFHLPKVHRRQSVNCQVGRSVVRSEYVKQKRRGRWAVGHHRHR